MENTLIVIGLLVLVAIGIYTGLWFIKREDRKKIDHLQERELLKKVYPPLTTPTTLTPLVKARAYMGRKDGGWYGVLRMLNRKRDRTDYHV